jgi:hypothetical protein
MGFCSIDYKNIEYLCILAKQNVRLIHVKQTET